MPTPPILTTNRLALRPHTRDDFLESYTMWSDPEVIRYIGGKPFTREEVWARLLRYAGHCEQLRTTYKGEPTIVLRRMAGATTK
ncbi:hypothetical protein LMG27174_03823 [Paraburkholderia rhynchosiae]|uniref:N-acetyltransferase domain-containing protein n=1 Tax=Paraburkholderia rhynchosiae TaxID=487049 RepID=A0A6J5BET7_9BURK|nr:hypothetical protein LMG27174_03823 [Paraburkholderia rhynchosiae]